jgi:hypothetical protein
MLNKVSGIKRANKKTQKRWISEVKNNAYMAFLDPAFNKLYPEGKNSEGVDTCMVWDDIIKVGKYKALLILSDIDEIDFKGDFQEKALIYLMNAFVRENSEEFKIFPN